MKHKPFCDDMRQKTMDPRYKQAIYLLAGVMRDEWADYCKDHFVDFGEVIDDDEFIFQDWIDDRQALPLIYEDIKDVCKWW